MPYRMFTDDPTLFRLELHGTLTRDDLHQVVAELRAVEAGMLQMPDRLIDLSASGAREVTAHDLMLVAQLRRATIFPNSFRTAVVAPSDASLGFARMFQILNDHPQIEIGVFREEGEALRWLGRA